MKRIVLLMVVIAMLVSCSKILMNQLKKESQGKSVSDKYTNYKTGRIFHYDVDQILAKDTLQFQLAAHILPHKKLNGALIEYDYLYDKSIIERYFFQGRIDSKSNSLHRERTNFKDGDWVFLHPPRSYTLESLQLAPFPQFVKSKMESSGTLSIPKGNWGYWENSKISTTVAIDSIHYKMDSIPQKYFLSATTRNSIYGENRAWFVYDLDSGFVDMNYLFENGNKVRIALKSIETNIK